MPVIATIKKSFGESGYADVRIGKTSVKVMFDSGGYEVAHDQWEKGRPAGQYNITMSKDGTKISGVRPIAGTYIMQFEQMGNRIGEYPEPKIQRGGPRQSKDGTKKWFQPDSLVFSTVLTIQSEDRFKGLKVYNSVPYIFSGVPGTNITKLEANSKNELERVEVFLRVAGFDLATNDIPYSPNVLPWMENKLQELGRSFLGTVSEAGFVTSFGDLPVGLAPIKKARK